MEKGDLNHDGLLNEEDLKLMLKAKKGGLLLTKAQELAADFNGNGKFDSNDVTIFEKKFELNRIGDIDGNEIVNQEDLNLLIDVVVNSKKITEYEKRSMDVNQDGVVDDSDIVTMKKKFQPKPQCDLNEDGILDAKDIDIFYNYLNGKIGFTQQEINASDMDGDGNLDKHDLYLFIKHIEDIQDGKIKRSL